ncbi:hypothetical protein CANCADRAFT_107074 [Tortispora caseinolytica NRRL Y-17796]|uniref:Uncharacterized protein n=1 Tax=Tortispora caseinolytica NRRL Y-17796 TaxID=767744 RepID=A0A1E4TFM5_9ASCO|nr:hypothetical protein CANCADRAFT_107074 [Tortispora caseinolytica NRRL Y-17796]
MPLRLSYVHSKDIHDKTAMLIGTNKVHLDQVIDSVVAANLFVRIYVVAPVELAHMYKDDQRVIPLDVNLDSPSACALRAADVVQYIPRLDLLVCCVESKHYAPGIEYLITDILPLADQSAGKYGSCEIIIDRPATALLESPSSTSISSLDGYHPQHESEFQLEFRIRAAIHRSCTNSVTLMSRSIDTARHPLDTHHSISETADVMV